MAKKNLEVIDLNSVLGDPSMSGSTAGMWDYYLSKQPVEVPEESNIGSGDQSWLSSIISELAGAGGATGGAALGASLGSVVPGVGTVIGGILGGIGGGFLGGTGGRLAENQIRDNEMRLGDALKEGALSGAFGGLGAGFTAARGLKAAGGLKNIASLSDDIAKATGQNADDVLQALTKQVSLGGKKAGQALALGQGQPNFLQAAGRGFRGNAQGVGIGAKTTGVQPLGAGASDDILSTLKNYGIPDTNPEKALRILEPTKKKLGTQIAKSYSDEALTYSSQQLDDVVKNITTQIADDPAIQLGKSASQNLDDQLKLLKNAKTPEQVWKYQQKLGKSINFGKNASSKLVDREAVATVIRNETGKLLDDTVPAIRALRTDYSNLALADDLMKAASKQADKSGLFARVSSSSAVRGGEAKLGGALEGVGNLVSGSGGLAKLGAGAVARGAFNGGELPQQPMTSEQIMPGVGDLSSALGQMQMPQEQSIYPRENLLYDIQRDPENADKYVAYYQLIQSVSPQTSMGSGFGNSGIVSSEKLSNAMVAMNGIQQLKAMLQEDPGVVGRTFVPGRTLPYGIGGNIANISGTAEFDALGYNIADTILRIRTGAQANESEVRQLQSQLMPRAGDSAETIQFKLGQLEDAVAPIMQLAQ